jgi:predicted molibdopterin-dependent oxidoreductase YjgC
VLELAEQAPFVLTFSMFENELTGWSHVVVPGTSYLERDGTFVNLEGRPQRVRRAVVPPHEDELEFVARLAQRLGIAVDAWPSGPLPAEHAELPPADASAPQAKLEPSRAADTEGDGLRLVRYRSLFSGAAVERVPQLQFQRSPAEVELSEADAASRKLATGSTVTVRSNGTSRTLRARVNRRLRGGVVRVAAEHAGGLGDRVEVTAP